MPSVFKIQRMSDSLFSTGGTNVTFKKKGKIWPNRQAVSAHITLLREWSHYTKKDLCQVYRDCEVIEYDMIEMKRTLIEVPSNE